MELTLDQALQKGVEAHKAGKVQEADRYYTAILSADPKHPDANHNMGVLAVGVGKVAEALPFFKKALEGNPNIAQYWLSYIDALIKLDRIADAKAVFDQAKGKGAKGDKFDKLLERLSGQVNSGQSNKRIFDQATETINRGNYDEAINLLSDSINRFPKDPNLQALLSHCYILNDNLEQAKIFLDAAKKINRDIPSVGWNETRLLLKQNKLNEALTLADKTNKLFPDDVEGMGVLGSCLRANGNFDASLNYLNKAIELNPNYAEALINRGLIRLNKKDNANALTDLEKAHNLKPHIKQIWGVIIGLKIEVNDFEDTISLAEEMVKRDPVDEKILATIALCYQHLEKHDQAVAFYKKAINIRPDFAEAYNNMGNALQEQGKLEEAIEAFKTALSIKPDYADAYNNMGNTLQEQGKLEEAIEAYNKAISIKPDFADAYNNMGISLKGAIFKKPNKALQKTICSLLDKKTSVRPKDIAKSVIDLLKFEPTLQNNLQLDDDEIIQNPLGIVSDLSELSLLLKLMSVCPLPDLEVEKLLKTLRCSILSNLLHIKDASPGLLRFQSALALQSFTNEYIYSHTKEEEKILQSLDASIKKALKNKEQPSPQAILALASYKALNQYAWNKLLVVTNDIKEIFTRQVEEPNQEGQLKKDLPVLEEITDKISSKVREQYEESPYPRWVNLGLRLEAAPISKVVREIQLKLVDDQIKEAEKPEILIAGCGTGEHSIGTASKFKGSKVLAIDLSLSSLGYAKRKTEELGIQNIEYMQADILDLGKFNKQFDIIESAGVLHHMDNPMAGWKVLTDCMKPGGLIMIGLYSELARQDIIKIRNEISNANIGSSDEEMKSFRDTIMRSEKDHHKLIMKSPDFYSLSTLRDLLFHVQEHRFTIPQIADYLDQLGLKFSGFEDFRIVSHFQKTNTNKNDPYDLDKWQSYEQVNPRSFGGMYQFWCQKAE